ncbi:MAG: DNA cytosine methyltransferase [Ramlibacter sp.]|nr:DNA cytosine methyltransferase [Ramlibacter sp.]
MTDTEILHGHLFCGLGGGAKGFNRARPVVGSMRGKFRCLGGIDVDPASIRDFEKLAGVPGTLLDLFDRDQYRAFHGREPAPDWREATPADIHRAFGHERPHIVFLSAPCKGFSGLLSETKSLTGKYQALNRLTERGVWLLLEAFKDDPIEMILFENVPRIATRGRPLLDRIASMVQHYGYAWRETTHDCGKIGNLAQSRKRFLGVGRHMAKVPPFLYEPDQRPLRAVGDVLGRMLLPGDLRAGPMHRIPRLNWKTWVRLAFVEAGSDWRSLNKLAVEDGVLRDFLIVPESRHSGMLGVNAWGGPVGTVTSRGLPNNGNFAVADPRAEVYSHGYGVNAWEATAGAVSGESLPSNGRFAVADPRAPAGAAQYGQYGVLRMGDTSGAIIGVKSPGQGHFAVADVRTGTKHNNCFRVVRMDQAAGAVTGGGHPSAGGQSVADPRSPGGFSKYGVSPWDGSARTVISGSTTGEGAFAVADPRATAQGKLFSKYPVSHWDGNTGTVIGGDDTGAYAIADPRPALARGKGDHYLTGGHYGVVRMDQPSYAVAAAACHDNGHWSVADARPMPAPTDKLVCRITALDGTWHRPFTTLELAALQSLVDPEEQLELDGLSDQAWRERIGNAVPANAATAIAEVMGETLLLAWAGETFRLSAKPIWVRPVAVALAVGGA